MGKIGACVVIYGSRGSAIADTLRRSNEHDVELYIADKNNNPFNRSMAKKHVVIPDLNVNDIADFVGENKDSIDFVFPGSEGPIIDGLHDIVYDRHEIPVLCPTKAYAIENSKVAQRELIGNVCPDANPRYRVFKQGRPMPEYGYRMDEME